MECQEEEEHRENHVHVHQSGLSRDLQVVSSHSSVGGGQGTMVRTQAVAMEAGFVLQVTGKQRKVLKSIHYKDTN